MPQPTLQGLQCLHPSHPDYPLRCLLYPHQGPSARTFTTIAVVTPWIRSLLFQLTMADQVKVMLVTIIFFIFCVLKLVNVPKLHIFYCPQMKLQEGNVFTGVCLSTRGCEWLGGVCIAGGMCGCGCMAGVCAWLRKVCAWHGWGGNVCGWGGACNAWLRRVMCGWGGGMSGATHANPHAVGKQGYTSYWNITLLKLFLPPANEIVGR